MYKKANKKLSRTPAADKKVKTPKAKSMDRGRKKKPTVMLVRAEENPIILPKQENGWEAWQTFNPGAILLNDKVHFLYRAVGEDGISRLGYAASDDGFVIDERLPHPVYEHKLNNRSVFHYYSFASGGSFGGAEDPRIVRVDNEDVLYMTYTACDNGLRVALTSIKVKDFLQRNWRWKLSTLISPPGEVHKNWVIFPEKINGKYAVLHSISPEISIAYRDRLEFKEDEYIQSYYDGNGRRKNCWDTWWRGAGAPPVKTKYGWLLFYSYIRNYFSSPRLFSIEAVLLDLENPLKIVARTDFPVLTPEEYYEKHGLVPNVIFPSGALLKKNVFSLYYGAADTTCSLAFIDAPSFLRKLIQKNKPLAKFTRAKENPIIIPLKNHPWEAKLTFNPAAIHLEGKVHILYRAMSEDNTSVIGYATSQDGIHIDYRHPEPVYVPRESFEQKLQSGGNSGAEDPRLVQSGGKIYLFYIAFNGKNPPRVALTRISARDFLNKKWNWSRPVLISPPDLDDKDAAMFPEKIKGKYVIIHRSGDDIDLSFHDTLNFDGTRWLEEYRWIMPRKGWWDSRKVGIAAPPIKTRKGWVLLYHGVSEEDGFYRVGAALTDLHDPTKIIGRTDYPIFEPETEYEKKGEVPNVVFPCGAVVIGKTLFMYYGGGDHVVGVATMELENLLEILEVCKC